MKFAFSIWMVLSSLAFAEGQAPSILKFDQESVHVTGLTLNSDVTAISDSEWKDILFVYTHEAWLKKIFQPISGTWTVTGDQLIFKPHFRFSPGETYHVVFDGNVFNKHISGGNSFTREKFEQPFSLPAAETLPASIDAVYPVSKIVPENLLRMYICFSSPMMVGESYDHIRLLREDGTMVEKAFLVLDQELWDAERKRFTLLFDPGRIKRTLKSNLDLGTPLKEGESYQLVIDSTWRDANGKHLQSGYRKELIVAAAQRTRISTGSVSLRPPKANSREEVVLSFDRPMDHVLMSKYISLSHSSVGEISGTVQMVDDFTCTFTPDHDWLSGRYEVKISPWVEDVCGNNFNNAFDLDLEKEKRVNSDTLVKLSFFVKSLAQ